LSIYRASAISDFTFSLYFTFQLFTDLKKLKKADRPQDYTLRSHGGFNQKFMFTQGNVRNALRIPTRILLQIIHFEWLCYISGEFKLADNVAQQLHIRTKCKEA
jgi:hypothetical protein